MALMLLIVIYHNENKGYIFRRMYKTNTVIRKGFNELSLYDYRSRNTNISTDL